MWTYILGPILAFLPEGWRMGLPFARRVHWAHAVALSRRLSAGVMGRKVIVYEPEGALVTGKR